ncbi:MAG: SDR family oxidoreductase [Actinomycetota bacterium]
MSARLADKVAIVTGAAQGTGAVIARRFVEEGASVVLGDVKADQVAALADSLGARALAVDLDVREPDSWAAVVAAAVEAFGPIDVLVNNAAVLLLESLVSTTKDDFLRLVEVNQLGPYLGIQAVFESMRANGGGSIVNISSTDGVKGMNGVSAYASTKWGLRGITKSSAIELGRHRIRVNAVCPEAGNPNMSSEFLPGNPDLSGMPHQMMQAILAAPDDAAPESRVGDVAAMALFLASDESMSCTGADFVVDAGLTVGQFQEFIPTT